jgi:hypothetical protein
MPPSTVVWDQWSAVVRHASQRPQYYEYNEVVLTRHQVPSILTRESPILPHIMLDISSTASAESNARAARSKHLKANALGRYNEVYIYWFLCWRRWPNTLHWEISELAALIWYIRRLFLERRAFEWLNTPLPFCKESEQRRKCQVRLDWYTPAYTWLDRGLETQWESDLCIGIRWCDKCSSQSQWKWRTEDIQIV